MPSTMTQDQLLDRIEDTIDFIGTVALLVLAVILLLPLTIIARCVHGREDTFQDLRQPSPYSQDRA